MIEAEFATETTARIQRQATASAGAVIQITAGTELLGTNLVAGQITFRQVPSGATIACDESVPPRLEIPPSEQLLWDQMDAQPLPDALLKRLSSFQPPQEWLDEPNDF